MNVKSALGNGCGFFMKAMRLSKGEIEAEVFHFVLHERCIRIYGVLFIVADIWDCYNISIK